MLTFFLHTTVGSLSPSDSRDVPMGPPPLHMPGGGDRFSATILHWGIGCFFPYLGTAEGSRDNSGRRHSCVWRGTGTCLGELVAFWGGLPATHRCKGSNHSPSSPGQLQV